MTRDTTDDPRTNRATNERETDRRDAADGTMGGVSHTHPETGETFGDSQVFERGTFVAADGGAAGAHTDTTDDETTDADGTTDTGDDRTTDADGTTDADENEEPMGDVDHTPRENAPEANAAYTRGADREEDDGTGTTDGTDTDESTT